ncbi:MerR family transcriptional regulator [Flexibacterium corallicola]|uniref:hypothetical protein n=1 Tax=Flexibacterium corallicola TaxID=3037259 RepID=UPI00286EDFD5|nr:hypothetical protein [Pseudovibrio sp. M1P-2-3]
MLSLGQAAKEAGIAKSTLSRAIKEGKVSAEKLQNGSYKIDPAELFRAFPAKQSEPVAQPTIGPFATPENTVNLLIENKVMQRELDVLRERLAEKDQQLQEQRLMSETALDDARTDRDHWRQQATALLEDKRPEAPSSRASSFERLIKIFSPRS